MSPVPPRSTSTSMCRAPASRLFSTSSLTTDAGRSITSPAAIWSTSSLGRTRMGMPARGDDGRALVRARERSVSSDARPARRCAALKELLAEGGGGAGSRRLCGAREPALLLEARAVRRVLPEVAAHAPADRIRKTRLLVGTSEAALFGGIGDVGGLDQHRGEAR